MKQKVIALFMIIVMVASALTAVGLATTTTVAAATTTKTTVVALKASTTTPTVGQPVTFTARLYSWNPATNQWILVSGKSVTILHYLNGVRYTDTTKPTVNGQITLKQTFGSAGQRYYYATFAGDSTYKTSTSSPALTITVTPKETILSPRSAVTGRANVGQKFSLNGFLTDQNSKGLAGQKIQFYSRTSTSAPWRGPFVTVYTDSYGYYQYDVFFNQLALGQQYLAKYDGDSSYAAKTSGIWTVDWKFQPQLSLQVSSSSLPVGGTVTFYGYLKDQNGFRPGEPLGGRTVTLHWRNDPTSGWNVVPQTTTDKYGYYSFATISDHSQTVYYYVSYDPAKQTTPESNTYWNVDSSQVTVTWT